MSSFHKQTDPSHQGSDSPSSCPIPVRRLKRLSSDALNYILLEQTMPQLKPHQVARSNAAKGAVRRAREEETGGREVALAKVMRPHRHEDDKDAYGCLSSFKSRRADHHTVNPH